jgi:hypothetical protein
VVFDIGVPVTLNDDEPSIVVGEAHDAVSSCLLLACCLGLVFGGQVGDGSEAVEAESEDVVGACVVAVGVADGLQ